MMQSIHLGLTLYRRHAKKGLLTIMLAAVLLGVASFTTISVFGDRLIETLSHQASEMLGGDMVISGTQAVPKNWDHIAQALNIRTTETIDFLSMLLFNDHLELGSIKAIQQTYPLYGKIKISNKPYQEGHPTSTIPEPGTIWLENRLLMALNADIGDTLQLGEAHFKITHIITYDPGSSSVFFNISPQALINQADIPKTQLVVPGSRVTYRLLLAGNQQQLNEWMTQTKPEWSAKYRLQDLSENSPRIAESLSNTIHYLNLTTLVTLILAAIAIAMTAQKYCEEQYKLCALLRCFGAKQRQILQILMIILVIVALIGGLIGLFLGYLAQEGLVYLFKDLTQQPLLNPSIKPFLISILLGFLLLFGFALPPLLRLKNAPAWQVLRNQRIPLPGISVFAYLLAGFMTLFVIYLLTRSISLTFFVLSIIAISFTLFYYFTDFILMIIARLKFKMGLSWKYAIATIVRYKAKNIFQIISISLAIMVFLILTVVRQDLFDAWIKEIPEQTPNYFAFNIESHDLPALSTFFEKNHIEASQVYPLIRGQIIAINNKPIDYSQYSNSVPNVLNRPLNLTWSNVLPPDNSITTGQWFNKLKEHKGISIEQSMAESLHLTLGNTLTFQIADQTITAPITSIRAVEWDNFKPNFYTIFPAGMLDQFPKTYLTSFYLNPEKDKLILELTRMFPNISVIDMDAMIAQARHLIEQVFNGIQVISFYSYFATLLVLAAALSTSLGIRLYENAILKSLGANKQQLLKNILSEYLISGVISGVLAAIAAYIAAYCFTHYLLDIAFSFNVKIVFLSVVIGILVHLIGALLLYRKVNRTSAMVLLREAS